MDRIPTAYLFCINFQYIQKHNQSNTCRLHGNTCLDPDRHHMYFDTGYRISRSHTLNIANQPKWTLKFTKHNYIYFFVLCIISVLIDFFLNCICHVILHIHKKSLFSYSLLVLHRLPIYPAEHPVKHVPSTWEHWLATRQKPHVLWHWYPCFPISHSNYK